MWRQLHRKEQDVQHWQRVRLQQGGVLYSERFGRGGGKGTSMRRSGILWAAAVVIVCTLIGASCEPKADKASRLEAEATLSRLVVTQMERRYDSLQLALARRHVGEPDTVWTDSLQLVSIPLRDSIHEWNQKALLAERAFNKFMGSR